MTEHAGLVQIARMRPTPGKRQALLGRLHQQAQAMRTLPGLFGAQVCEMKEDPSELVLISRWRNEKAMRGLGTGASAGAVKATAELVEHEDVEHFVST